MTKKVFITESGGVGYAEGGMAQFTNIIVSGQKIESFDASKLSEKDWKKLKKEKDPKKIKKKLRL
jgi:hypothetical protein